MNISDTEAQTKNTQIIRRTMASTHLGRSLTYDLYLPLNLPKDKKLKTLYMNDGQDGVQLKLESILDGFPAFHRQELMVVAIHTNEHRLSDYGTSYLPDYKGRGGKAMLYMQFVLNELMPAVRAEFPSATGRQDNFFCGFSLGGLSAIDIVWENPSVFSAAGVFSGSFWWRSKAYEEGYDDDLDRIMHTKVRNGSFKEGLRFWLECGTNDEKEDRNKNGIIDAIDDTQDLIKELKKKGYKDESITYVEIEGGEHNFSTWHKAFPQFLTWVMAQ